MDSYIQYFACSFTTLFKIAIGFHKKAKYSSTMSHISSWYPNHCGKAPPFWISQDFGDHPIGCRKQVQRIPKMARCQFRFLYVVAVGLVDDNAIRHLHDTPVWCLCNSSPCPPVESAEKSTMGVPQFHSAPLPPFRRISYQTLLPRTG